jgi:ATP-dependent Clp protease ATP-binding subunit ClpA
MEAIDKLFTPEFRNRLDAIIPFAALPPDVVAMVVDKFIIQLETQLTDRGVSIELDTEARAWLAKKGYDPLYGARPLARVIQETIKKPLAEELLFGRLARGGTVLVTIKDNGLVFSYPDPPLRTPHETQGTQDPPTGPHRRERDKIPELAE